ncbi:Fc receptor-like protein 5 isoform X2 [Aquarana catesbeiana]|uniref:Fc receptor-like protein 5 isoform X2 n=1 Tax=Aquarana catesbeiana TaxID=8400 RepID=UPI003CC94217
MMMFTFVVLILALVTSESALVRPVVTFTPPWRRIISADTVTIACDIGATAQENETFYWYRDEKLMDIHEQNFTVPSASAVYNGGDYQCRTSTGDISDPVYLDVRYAYVLLQKPSSIFEGDPLTLRCYSPPGLNGTNTTFYKDGEEIQFSVNNSELYFDKVNRSATGTYRCTKTVQFGEFRNSSSETYVYVRGDEVKSLVTFTPNWRTVMSMDSVTLICNVGSAEQEKETFYWYRDDRLIYNYQQNFTIQSANWRYDRGYYQCRTSTSDISEPVTLNIKNRDLVLQRPTSIYEGHPLTLRCLSRSSFIVINTTFYKDDKMIKFSTSDTELHIMKVDRNVTGMYKCVQRLHSKLCDKNGTPISSKTLSDISYITVRAVVRPVVTFTPNWRNLLSGDSVTVTCDVGSAVQNHQTYYWYKDEKVLSVTQREFTIPSASQKDGGEYKCRIKSSDMSHPTRLEVSDAEVILQQDASSAYEGTPLTLRCHSRSEYNRINTAFYKDDEEIQSSATDSTLRIEQLNRQATGNYKCSQVLADELGFFNEDSAEIYIYVKETTDVTDTASSALAWPVVTFTPPWRRILSRDTVTITCDLGTTAQENENFYWYRDEKLIDIHQQKFTIQSASVEANSGEYQCRSSTSDISEPLWLQVTQAEVILQRPPKIRIGDPLTLRCHSSPDWVEPTFYKEEEEIQSSLDNSELHFDKVDRNAIGTYRCDKTYYHKNYSVPIGWISHTYVYVGEGDEVKPLVTFTPNWRTIQEYDSVTLTCNVVSTKQEKETFYWYRNNEMILNNQQTFTLRQAKLKDDSGYYQCQTSTSDLSDPVKLEIEKADLILQRPTSIYEGDSLTLRCYTMYAFRAVNTTFFKDDKEIFFSASDIEFRIDKVDRRATGTYKCTQRLQRTSHYDNTPKPFETKSAKAHITVRAVIRPVVTFTPNRRNLLPGDSVTLTCDLGSAVQGDQTYYWYKDGKVLDITLRKFTISSASVRDGGEYKCRTKSSYISYATSLEVSDGPTNEVHTPGTSGPNGVRKPKMKQQTPPGSKHEQ